MKSGLAATCEAIAANARAGKTEGLAVTWVGILCFPVSLRKDGRKGRGFFLKKPPDISLRAASVACCKEMNFFQPGTTSGRVSGLGCDLKLGTG